ncbi:transcriptional regulator family: Fungal Specific TF [Penicillium roqueforti]|nr:transcriptional regulator family: Fungal Specific TF [Penicillium roqueforti]KAI3107851.1 transcriptional regulator family: Fungal Specific TF [Penicillium roqueforti]
MPGVPHSKGCLQCISRKVKCDKTRPECLRCINWISECPGYDRGHKFKDQTRYITLKHGRPTMDEAFAPNLAYEAINVQTQESFEVWLDYHFPSYLASFNSRVEMNWMKFIRGRWSTFPQALIWALRALTCLRMGAARGNKEAIMCARHMYGRGVNHLASLLHTRAALADETLAAAILLGGYEVLDGSSDRSWIIHSHGIRHLFCARGPSAHTHGMGRTLLISWRPYLVADAFIHAEPCFLGGSEWTCVSAIQEIARAEDRWQESSLLGQTMDYAFNEVAKCPGYYAMTKYFTTSDTDVDRSILNGLVSCILKSRESLVQFHGMLMETDPPASFVGVIPSTYATTLVQGTRDGINSAVALLDQLMTLLKSHLNRNTNPILMADFDDKHQEDPWRLFAGVQALKTNTNQSLLSRDQKDPGLSIYAVRDQLDKFSLTMGMGSLLPDACGCPQFLAHI